MASSFCHVDGVAMQFRLERIVRPRHSGGSRSTHQLLALLALAVPRAIGIAISIARRVVGVIPVALNKSRANLTRSVESGRIAIAIAAVIASVRIGTTADNCEYERCCDQHAHGAFPQSGLT